MSESLVKTGLFWSYCHSDNDAENGLILDLASNIKKEYRLISGEELEIATDKEALAWGYDWRDILDDHLDSAQFFVAVITPCYIRSPECVREIKKFTEAATSMGAKELFLPLIYADVPEITNPNAAVNDALDQSAIDTIKRFQWEAWYELRFWDQGTGRYRRGINKLAQRLYEANRIVDRKLSDASRIQIEISQKPDFIKEEEKEEEAQSEDFGILEDAKEIEEQFIIITNTIKDIGEDIVSVGAVTSETNDRIAAINKNGGKNSTLLIEVSELAKKLAPPAQGIYDKSKTYSEQLDSIDRKVSTVITETRRINPQASNKFDSSVIQMADTAETAVASITNMKDSISGVIGISRELNKPLRMIQTGLDIFISATDIIFRWRDLAESTKQMAIAAKI